MIFSVSIDSIDWSLDFGSDSVSLTVKDVIQALTIASQENRLATLSLLLSQRQEILNKLIARVPVTPNQKGSHEVREDVVSSVGAQGRDTSGYQVSDV